jgi:hypothetical protein
VAVDLQDGGVVAVEDRGGDGGVFEDLAPAGDAAVARSSFRWRLKSRPAKSRERGSRSAPSASGRQAMYADRGRLSNGGKVANNASSNAS